MSFRETIDVAREIVAIGMFAAIVVMASAIAGVVYVGGIQ